MRQFCQLAESWIGFLGPLNVARRGLGGNEQPIVAASIRGCALRGLLELNLDTAFEINPRSRILDDCDDAVRRRGRLPPARWDRPARFDPSGEAEG